MTQTQTKTRTRTRFAALSWQIESVAVRLLPHGADVFAQYLQPALEQRTFAALTYVAVTANGECQAEFSQQIDWREHQAHLTSHTEISLPADWIEDLSPEIKLVLTHYEKLVAQKQLRIRPYLRLCPGHETVWAGRPPRRQRPPTLGGHLALDRQVRRLEELRLYYALADD